MSDCVVYAGVKKVEKERNRKVLVGFAKGETAQ